MAARSKAWICGPSIFGNVASNSAGGMSVLSVVCCQVEVYATGQSPVQRIPTVCVCVSLSVIRCNSNTRTPEIGMYSTKRSEKEKKSDVNNI